MTRNRELESKIEVFYNSTNWLIQQFHLDPLEENGLKAIKDRLDSLLPIAVDYEMTLKEYPLGYYHHEIIQQLETAASSLWNTIEVAIRLDKNEKIREILCYSQLFACILLSIHERLMPSAERKLRITQCSLNLLKLVINHEWVQLFQILTAHLKRTLELMEEAGKFFNEKDNKKFRRLKLQIQFLNFQNALRQGDIDKARDFENQANIVGNVTILDPDLLLDFCRMIYNAVLILKRSSFPDLVSSLPFLQHALEYLKLDVASLKSHVDYTNLRYSLLLLLTDSQVEQDIELSNQTKCEESIRALRDEYPERLEPYFLEITFRKKMDTPDKSRSIKEIIIKMTDSVNIRLNFDACIGIIKDFSDFDSRCALECLDYIFINKWDPEKDHKWLEKLLIFRFFLTTQSKHLDNAKIIRSLEEFCNRTEQMLIRDLSKHAISTVITLLWNSGKKSEKSKKYLESIGFYKLALKDFICQTYADIGKIQRALMSAYLQIEELNQCKELFEKMAPADKSSPLTQLILLKIFILKKEEKSSLECLRRIGESKHENAMDVLILAAAECKSSKELAVKAITIFFGAMESNKVTEKQLVQWSAPVLCLLRYTSQLIIKFADNEQQEVFINYLPTMQELLEKALQYLNKVRILEKFSENSSMETGSQGETSMDEIEWFASTSYNIAVKCFAENVDNSNGIDFAQLSRNFLKLIPHQRLTFSKAFHYTYWEFRSHLLCLTIAQTTKCSYDLSTLRQVQEEAYMLATDASQWRNSEDFDDRCGSDEKNKIVTCLNDSLSLAFESSLKLQDQLKISEILMMTSQWKNPQIENLLAESVISTYELPRDLFMETIEQIVQRNINNRLIDDFKICQWLRSLLDCALTLEKTSQLDTTQHLLERIKSSVTSSHVPNKDQLKQEIEMIATLSWNQGVSCIIKEEQSLGTKWCHTSIQFASLYSAQLEAHLHELWNSLASSAHLIND